VISARRGGGLAAESALHGGSAPVTGQGPGDQRPGEAGEVSNLQPAKEVGYSHRYSIYLYM